MSKMLLYELKHCSLRSRDRSLTCPSQIKMFSWASFLSLRTNPRYEQTGDIMPPPLDSDSEVKNSNIRFNMRVVGF
jgi:hypothetical protein